MDFFVSKTIVSDTYIYLMNTDDTFVQYSNGVPHQTNQQLLLVIYASLILFKKLKN
jgi:hypothetical protein